MPQTNYTPIQLYRSTTASAAPTAGNLTDGELAINTTDEKVYFKNTAGTVKQIVTANGTQTLTNKTLTSPSLTSPTMTTPTLGVATATSVNKVNITAPAVGATLTIANARTLTVNGSITLAGTDGSVLSLAGNLTTSGAFASTFTMSGITTVTFPTTGTLATLAGSEALTNKTVNGLTPTAAAVGFTIAGGTTSKTLTISNTLSFSGTDSTVMTFPPATASVGYMNIPQNSQSAAYTLVLADAGKHILHPSADTTARIFTIPANASVAFPIGTAVTFINQNGGGVITIAITTDTMRLAGAGTTGSRTLAANGVATAVKVTSTEWIISGGSSLT